MHASAYALNNGEKFIQKFKKEYVKRRNLLNDRMAEIPALRPGEIEGSFYAFPGYALKMKSRELSRKLLQGARTSRSSRARPSGRPERSTSGSASRRPRRRYERAMDGMKSVLLRQRLG